MYAVRSAQAHEKKKLKKIRQLFGGTGFRHDDEI